MIDGRDRQRSKVYAWEERFVAPYDPSTIELAQAQGIVDAIWTEMGLRFPPKVEPFPHQARTTMADAIGSRYDWPILARPVAAT